MTTISSNAAAQVDTRPAPTAPVSDVNSTGSNIEKMTDPYRGDEKAEEKKSAKSSSK